MRVEGSRNAFRCSWKILFHCTKTEESCILILSLNMKNFLHENNIICLEKHNSSFVSLASVGLVIVLSQWFSCLFQWVPWAVCCAWLSLPWWQALLGRVQSIFYIFLPLSWQWWHRKLWCQPFYRCCSPGYRKFFPQNFI